MLIRTEQRIAAGLSLAMTLLAVAVLVQLFLELNGATERNRVSGQVVRSATGLRAVTFEVLLHREDRPINQWRRIHGALERLLTVAQAQETQERAVLERMRQSHGSLKTLFDLLTADPEADADRAGRKPLTREREDLLAGRLLIESHELVAGSLEWGDLALADIVRKRYRIGWFFMISMTLLAALAVATALAVNRLVLRPLKKLHDGTGIVAGGDLDHRLGITSHDEMGALGRAFDAMTGKLKASYDEFDQRLVARTAELAASERRFQAVVESAPTAMVMTDKAGAVVLVNAQAEALFGYTRDELLGQAVEVLVPPRFRVGHPAHRVGFSARPQARRLVAGRDLYGRRKDGTDFPVEIGLNTIETAEGLLVLSTITDISKRKLAEEERVRLTGQLRALNAELEERAAELSKTLKEREVMLQEIHHRVKNNLQLISSVINIQVRKLERGASRDALQECQGQVHAIALIHEQLYQSRDYSRVSFAEYARSLVANVFNATGVSPVAVSLEIEIGDVALAVDKAIPCALIMNELITNALKHGFPGDRRGVVRVELERSRDGCIRLAVRDDGVGLPAGVNVRQSESLGLQLVSTLAEQLNATLEVQREQPGTSFQLTFQT